jgi:hypothetical protein
MKVHPFCLPPGLEDPFICPSHDRSRECRVCHMSSERVNALLMPDHLSCLSIDHTTMQSPGRKCNSCSLYGGRLIVCSHSASCEQSIHLLCLFKMKLPYYILKNEVIFDCSLRPLPVIQLELIQNPYKQIRLPEYLTLYELNKTR